MISKESHVELHVHPNFKAYGLEEIIKAMDKNNLDVIVLEYLNYSIFNELQVLSSDLRKKGYSVDSDSIALRIEKENKQYYLIKGEEIEALDDFHLLTIGSDNIAPYHPIERLIDYALKQEVLIIFDHPFVRVNNLGRQISKKKMERVEELCRKYNGTLALEWNAYCLNLYWSTKKLFRGINVNEEVRKLSDRLKKQGYNIPIVADTDLHARSKKALRAIGTARIKSGVDLSSGRTIIDSLKKDIFLGKHENVYRTVSLTHLIPNFALPYISQRFFKRA